MMDTKECMKAIERMSNKIDNLQKSLKSYESGFRAQESVIKRLMLSEGKKAPSPLSKRVLLNETRKASKASTPKQSRFTIIKK